MKTRMNEAIARMDTIGIDVDGGGVLEGRVAWIAESSDFRNYFSDLGLGRNGRGKIA